MGLALNMVDALGFDLGPRLAEGHELHDVQTFVSQPAMERLDVPVSMGFPGRIKSSFTPRRQAQSSSALEVNSDL